MPCTRLWVSTVQVKSLGHLMGPEDASNMADHMGGTGYPAAGPKDHRVGATVHNPILGQALSLLFHLILTPS